MKFKIFNGFAIIAIALSLSACKTTIEPSDEVNVKLTMENLMPKVYAHQDKRKKDIARMII